MSTATQNTMNTMNITQVIDGYTILSLDNRYKKCLNKLYETENKIDEYTKMIFEEWKYIELLYIFESQKDYVDYMISTHKYAHMMKVKDIVERELESMDIEYENINEH